MNGITPTISFANIELLNHFYSELNKRAVEICKRYDVPQLWDNARIYKNESTKELSIISLGTYVKGSNMQTAVNEILSTFEKMINL